MASASGFPQLPTTVWRGVWQSLNRAPNRRLDERSLAAELKVQPTAARQYLKELQKLGILSPEGQPTPLADRWRQNGNDPDVIEAILQEAYPDSLRHLAPPDDLDREKVIRWFLGEKLGTGSAKNKAATYLMVAQGVPEDGKTAPRTVSPAKASEVRTKAPRSEIKSRVTTKPESEREQKTVKSPQLAVNVQIHISADASTEQIDAIFSAMRRYFDESSAD
jgi:hypothetical protein